MRLSDHKVYVYIDTRIDGAIRQLLNYFDSGVLPREKIVVLCRVYRGTYRKYSRAFEKHGVSYKPILRYRELPDLSDSTILYFFNAQSNCRLVSYREARHIYVGHGESNKLSSAKPIFRIYDMVAVSGEASLRRFLDQGIFTECDIKNGKFLKVGNQFIGKLVFDYSHDAGRLLYAPTWEGGIEEENYSSIDRELKSFRYIAEFSKKSKIHTVVIQPHPNLGHRDPRYLLYLMKGVRVLENSGLAVRLTHWESTWKQKLMMKWLAGGKYLRSDERDVSFAFCDVSAMEIQLLDQKIPYYIFASQRKHYVPEEEFLKSYYQHIMISPDEPVKPSYSQIDQRIRKYYIEPLSERMEF